MAAKPTRKRETQREKMKRYYLRHKNAGRKPGPKPPPPFKVEGDMFDAFTHFLNAKTNARP